MWRKVVVVDCCEHGNKQWRSINAGEFLEQLSDSLIPVIRSALWLQSVQHFCIDGSTSGATQAERNAYPRSNFVMNLVCLPPYSAVTKPVGKLYCCACAVYSHVFPLVIC